MGTNEYAYVFDPIGNRTAVTNNGEAVAYAANAHDHQSRRIRKETFAFDGATSQYALKSDRSFVYDGWNVIREKVAVGSGSTQSEVVKYYTWGNDLSGTEQGAGGVGGLIAVSIYGMYYLPCYDHNGNIVAYVSESGNIEAQYAYNAFGGTLWQSGMMADLFRFRFSTKYQDASTGLYYYGYRFYSPELMRFLNRDPIEERGGLNLYGFVGNDPVNRWDRLGLSFWNCCDDCTETIIDSTEVRIFPAAYAENFVQASDHGQSLLDALGASGNGSDVADLAMSMTSLSGVLVSAARIAINRGMNTGADDALEAGLRRLRSNVDSAYGAASGYLATVRVKYRPCDASKICWKLKRYKTWSSAKTIADTTPGR